MILHQSDYFRHLYNMQATQATQHVNKRPKRPSIGLRVAYSEVSDDFRPACGGPVLPVFGLCCLCCLCCLRIIEDPDYFINFGREHYN
jgi:hypothetical protein